MIEEYYKQRIFDYFLKYRIPYDTALRHMIIEICLLYDGKYRLAWIRADRSISRDEAVERLVTIHKNFKDGYEGLFNDYWPDKDAHKYYMKNTLDIIKEYGGTYKEYLYKYAP